MTVRDFVNMEAFNDVVYRIVDINARGCMTDKRKIECEDYKHRIKEQYGDCRLERFEIAGKRTMILYCDFNGR